MLVEHHGVEAHFFSEDFFVDVAVVELGAGNRVVQLVANTQVEALIAHQTGFVVLPWLFGKVAN